MVPTDSSLLVIITFGQFRAQIVMRQNRNYYLWCGRIIVCCPLYLHSFWYFKYSLCFCWHHIFQMHCNVFILDACMSGYKIILNVSFLVAFFSVWERVCVCICIWRYKNWIKWFCACLNKIITRTLTSLTKPYKIEFGNTKKIAKSNTSHKH